MVLDPIVFRERITRAVSCDAVQSNASQTGKTPSSRIFTPFWRGIPMSRKTSLFGVVLFSLLGTALPQAAKAVTLGFTSGAYNTPGDLGLDPLYNILALDLGSESGVPVVAGGVTFVADNTSFNSDFPYSGIYTAAAPPTPSDADLNTIARSFVYKPNYTNNNAITYTVNGLTPTLTYRTQILFGGVNGNNGPQGTGGLTGAGVTITEGSDTLLYDNVPANTAAQYVNYTFVATGTSLLISLQNTNPAFNGTSDFSQFNINAFDVQLVPVPEPASLSMLVLGGVSLLRRASRRRKLVAATRSI